MSFFLKKQIFLLALLSFFSLVFSGGEALANSQKNNQKNSGGNPRYASIVVDAQSGQVLHERHADKVLYPASLTKMMTVYLAFEAIESGKWRPNTMLFVSKRAEGMEPTKLGLSTGSRISVMDAIKALIVKSANDIAVVVAEGHSGTEQKFAQAMTAKARQLGMRSTVFKNASGLPHPEQVSTARDMAILSAALMRDFPQHFHLFNLQSFKYAGVTHRSHNRLIGQYRGMDGMKTGYIRASGFNLVSTAQRGGRRLIGVVFGGRTAVSRNDHMVSLMDKSFSMLGQGVYMASNTATRSANGSLTPPKPLQKPTFAQMVASLDTSIQAARGDEDALVLQEEAIGQGSADVKRVAIAVPQEKPTSVDTGSYGYAVDRVNIAGRAPSQIGQKGDWAIQVGAFNSRVKSDYAIRNAQSKVPHLLSDSLRRTIPVKNDAGQWVFRARLTGLDRKAALQACKHLDDCIVIEPSR